MIFRYIAYQFVNWWEMYSFEISLADIIRYDDISLIVILKIVWRFNLYQILHHIKNISD